MGLTFPAAPVNGAFWVLWGFLFAGCLTALRVRASFRATWVLGWVFGFALMWVVTGNLGVLPWGLLPVAVLWSLIETGGAVWIAQKMHG